MGHLGHPGGHPAAILGYSGPFELQGRRDNRTYQQKMRSSHVPYIGGRWGMDWGSLGERSGIIVGWCYNGFVLGWFLCGLALIVGPTNDPNNRGSS